ncbi:MAG: Bug family tripartite tricarboxylate transporter substrate binding protein [Thermodesulfobacteriota bacterium]
MKRLVSRGSLRRIIYVSLVLLFAMAVGATLGPKTVEAKSKKDAAAFYKGKYLTFIVPYKPGGGYDVYSRILTPYLEKYTGTRVIVRNMPGAGGMLGVNEVYNAPANGLTIGIQNCVGSVTSQLTGVKGVRYDLTKFSWIGRVAINLRVLVMRKDSDITNVQKLINAKRTVKIGATGLGGSTYVDAVITKKVLNLPTEVIHGYDSSTEVDLGMLRGEIEGQWGSYSSRLKMIKAGEQFVILQSGDKGKRDPRLPDIPTFFEVAPSEKGKRILSTLAGMHETARPVAGPPGIPQERLEFLREAFYKAMHDPGFIKKAKKAKRPLNYLSGEETLKLVKSVLEIPEEDIKQIFIQAVKGSI